MMRWGCEKRVAATGKVGASGACARHKKHTNRSGANRETLIEPVVGGHHSSHAHAHVVLSSSLHLGLSNYFKNSLHFRS